MAPKRQNPLRMIGQQIHAIMPQDPLNSQDQNQATWAKVIESYESVPDIYQDFFQSHHSRGEAFPYTVLTPTYESSGDRITGKLVCAIDHTFYVLDAHEQTLTKVCYPIDEIYHVQVTHRPMDLRFKIDGITNLGIPSASTFGCSNATDYLFAPLFQRVRLRIDSLNEKAPSRHTERLDRWDNLHTWVMDMARHCLLPGEIVIESILQPEIRPGFFSISERSLLGSKCPTHTCILTDKELVLIREDQSQNSKDGCSGVCDFVPLNKIESLSMNRKNEKFLTISVQLANGGSFDSLFDLSHEDEVDQFLAQTRKLMPKERWYVRD